MKALLALAFGLVCCGAVARGVESSLALSYGVRISFFLPEPNERENIPLMIADKAVDAVVLSANQGSEAFFITHYPLPKTESGKFSADEAVAREVERCVANIGGHVVSRKVLTDLGCPAVEVVAKSPRSKTLVVKCRILCESQRIFSFTAVTTGDRESTNAARFFAAIHIERKNPNTTPESVTPPTTEKPRHP